MSRKALGMLRAVGGKCQWPRQRRENREGGERKGRTRTAGEDVLKAHVKGGVVVGGEDGPLLAGDVPGPAVLVADSVLDL